MIPRRLAVLAAAIALDRLLGEPPAALHPVVWIGRAIRVLDRHAPRSGPAAQFTYGAGMTTAIAGAAAATAMLAERLPAPTPIRFARDVWLLKSMFAVRALLDAGEDVRRPLAHGNRPAARTALRSLVSRDTTELSASLIAAAAIESLAENLTDSALAPWLAYAGGGLPAAAVYRAINTLDSMAGYRGAYEYLGKAPARADDLLNLVPARVGALLIVASSWMAGGPAARSWRIARSHHGRTASPNAGWTMAAMAGALGVTLEKSGAYRLGAGRQPAAADIDRAARLVERALALGALVAAGVIYLLQPPGWNQHATARRPQSR